MAENITKPNSLSVTDYLSGIADKQKRSDCQELVSLFRKATNTDPVMWGSAIIGFGSYHYKYASGRGGDYLRIGLSARASYIAIYGVIFYDHNTNLLNKLGAYTQGKGCLYIKQLTDVNLTILEEMVKNAYSQPHPSEAS